VSGLWVLLLGWLWFCLWVLPGFARIGFVGTGNCFEEVLSSQVFVGWAFGVGLGGVLLQIFFWGFR